MPPEIVAMSLLLPVPRTACCYYKHPVNCAKLMPSSHIRTSKSHSKEYYNLNLRTDVPVALPARSGLVALSPALYSTARIRYEQGAEFDCIPSDKTMKSSPGAFARCVRRYRTVCAIFRPNWSIAVNLSNSVSPSPKTFVVYLSSKPSRSLSMAGFSWEAVARRIGL